VRVPPFSLVPIPGRYVVPIARVSQTVAGVAGIARESAAEIAMPTYPAFDNQYLLRGHDAGAVRQVFSDRVLTFFGENPGWMVEGAGKRLLLNRLTPDEVRTYWRGAVVPSDLREIGNVISAVQEGTLREKLQSSPGVPASELRLFLTAAVDAAAQFRTGSKHHETRG
jgi:hypothetical protein